MKINMAKTAATLLLVNITLVAEDTTTLDDINVTTVSTASGYEQKLKDAPASITVISGEEIAKKSYTDLSDVLKSVPGVIVQGSGTEQSISIRGMSSSYTLFLIDGRPAQGGDTFEFNGGGKGQQLALMPPLEMIERIEVVRGPASGLYGSDAMGGVINIITKKVMNKWAGSVSTEYIVADKNNDVNGNGYNTSFVLNGPLIKDVLGFQLSGGIRGTQEGSQTAFGDSTTSDGDYINKNIGTKFTWKVDDSNTITTGQTHTDTLNKRTPGESLATTATASRQGSLKNNYFLSHDGTYDRLILSSYINYDYAKNNTTRGTGNGVQFETVTLNTQATYMFDTHTLSAGATYKNEQLSDGATGLTYVYNPTGYITLERYQNSLFLEDEWMLTDDLALTLSGRYDNNEQFGDQISPKAYLVYHLTDNLSLKGGVIAGYKAPSLRNSAPEFIPTSRGGYSLPNSELTPETSLTYESGLDYENNDLGLKSSLTVYQTDFKDRITRGDIICAAGVECVYNGVTYPAAAYSYRETVNVDEAEVKGVEFTFDYELTEDLNSRSNYTYTHSEQKSGSNIGEPLNDLPKHVFNTGLVYDITKATNLWSQLAFIGEGISDTTASVSYTTIDTGFIHKISKDITFKAGVYNITNKEVANSVNGYVDGRKYSFGMNYKF